MAGLQDCRIEELIGRLLPRIRLFQAGHDFRLSLLRDPRFAATVNDVLVEFGNGRYQALMDRFVNGADIARDELRHVWQDTTTSNAGWERPIYEEFFRAVRSLNASLPRERRLRVLLGDAPIDWDHVTTRAELRRWSLAKDVYAGDLVRGEVVLKQRRRVRADFSGKRRRHDDLGSQVQHRVELILQGLHEDEARADRARR